MKTESCRVMGDGDKKNCRADKLAENGWQRWAGMGSIYNTYIKNMNLK